jgi:hypothetical protein
MKLKIDAIEAKGLPLTMNGTPAMQPVLKIVAGEFEATTSRCIILSLLLCVLPVCLRLR